MEQIDPNRTPLPSDYSSEFGYQNITAPGVYPYRPVGRNENKKKFPETSRKPKTSI
jgi:hypothetical protein